MNEAEMKFAYIPGDGLRVKGVSSASEEATRLLDLLEPLITHCELCREPAVRVGVQYDDKTSSIFKGLCERHKGFGFWTNHDTAWGWD